MSGARLLRCSAPMGAYDTIDLRPSWGGLSLVSCALIFVFLSFVALAARFVLGYHFWSAVLWLVLPSLSLVGCSFAAVGLVRSARASRSPAWQRSPTALLGLLLNGTVLLSCLVALVFGR